MSFLPLKDWLYCAAIASILIAFGVYTHHERAIGAQHELAAVTSASESAKREAKKQIDFLNSQYQTALAAIEGKYADDTKAAASQHDADVARLRNYEARNSGANSVLGSPSGSPATPDAGPSGISPMGGAALALANALRQDDAALIECYRDRDALTGK